MATILLLETAEAEARIRADAKDTALDLDRAAPFAVRAKTADDEPEAFDLDDAAPAP